MNVEETTFEFEKTAEPSSEIDFRIGGYKGKVVEFISEDLIMYDADYFENYLI